MAKKVITILHCYIMLIILSVHHDAKRIGLEKASDVSSLFEDFQVEEAEAPEDSEEGFDKSIGATFDFQKFSKDGELKQSGNKKTDSFDQFLKGAFNIRGTKGNIKDEGQRKAAKYNGAETYAQKDAISIGSNGTDFNEKKNYRKGSKTRGFRRVQHKDEYQKDQVFYDENDSSGNFTRFGAKGEAARVGSGGKARAGKFDAASRDVKSNQEGFYDSGTLLKQLQGFSDAKGFDGNFKTDQKAESESGKTKGSMFLFGTF